MPTFGLIVEDETDEAVLTVLIEKCRRSRSIALKTRRCRGTVLGKFRGVAIELHRRYRVDKVLIVCDADNKDPKRIDRAFREQGLYDLGFPVELIVIKEELEAWLLADPSALQKVLGVSKAFASPENLRDPKRELMRLMPGAVAYTHQIARRIAEEIDLTILIRRCPAFLRLQSAVR